MYLEFLYAWSDPKPQNPKWFCDCHAQGSLLWNSQGDNGRKSTNYGNFSSTHICIHLLELLLIKVRGEEVARSVWPEPFSHTFPALLCSPAISSTFSCTEMHMQSHKLSRWPFSRAYALKLNFGFWKKKTTFLKSVSICVAEEWFHFLQREARGKSHVCSLPQFEHV